MSSRHALPRSSGPALLPPPPTRHMQTPEMAEGLYGISTRVYKIPREKINTYKKNLNLCTIYDYRPMYYPCFEVHANGEMGWQEAAIGCSGIAVDDGHSWELVNEHLEAGGGGGQRVSGLVLIGGV